MDEGALNHLLKLFTASIALIPARIHTLSVILWQALVVVEVLWFLIHLIISSEYKSGLLGRMLQQLIVLNVFFWMMLNGPDLMWKVLETFSLVGGRAAATGPLNPQLVLDQGIAIAGQLTAANNSNIFGIPIPDMMSVVIGLISILVMIVYVYIAAQLFIVMVEAHWLVSAASFFLAFSASRWTRPLSERFIGGVIGAGVKYFVLYSIVGVGTTLALYIEQLITEYRGSFIPSPRFYFTIFGVVGTFGAIAWKVPQDAYSWAMGGWSLGVPHILRSMGTMAGGSAKTAAVAGTAGIAAIAAAGVAMSRYGTGATSGPGSPQGGGSPPTPSGSATPGASSQANTSPAPATMAATPQQGGQQNRAAQGGNSSAQKNATTPEMNSPQQVPEVRDKKLQAYLQKWGQRGQ